MKVLAILSEKGGAGKTTVAVHLAVAAQLAGVEVAIVDLDPQASATDWTDRRGKESQPESVAIPPVQLDKWLAKLKANGADLIIIDTGRDSNNAGYTAAENADLVLIPCRGGGFDFRALNRTLNLCRLTQKRPCLLLNGMRPGAIRSAADAREAMLLNSRQALSNGSWAKANGGKASDQAIDFAPIVIHDRAIYRIASITGKAAQETDPKSAGALEITQLYMWLARQLGLSTKQQSNKKAIA